jgi:exopolyphosphatase / guanosine-5'-triphosphate,3'-diphosphate pyrophosphatase
MWLRHHGAVPVGVIDVGANTVRLHVARGGDAIYREKAMLRLGESIERYGAVPEAKLAETAATVAGFVAQARRNGADRIEVLVTSPGRQAANGAELLGRLAAATGVPVRLLSAEEEGRLAFLGAVAASRGASRRLIAVCDVGGGSAQIAVGTRREGAAWVRSVDIGSMRLTSRLLSDDPPGDAAVQAARAEVDRLLVGILPPLPEIALAVGGSARALRSIVGPRLGSEELDELAGILARTPSREIVELYGVDEQRVRTLAAGAVILAALCERLCVPLRVVRGGVREGAAIELASQREAA